MTGMRGMGDMGDMGDIEGHEGHEGHEGDGGNGGHEGHEEQLQGWQCLAPASRKTTPTQVLQQQISTSTHPANGRIHPEPENTSACNT